MIVGIGIDLIELHRIKKSVEDGERLAKRVLTERELKKYHTLPVARKVEFLAGRFAAKEALSKSFGTGIGRELSFQHIEILANEQGAPIMKVNSDHLDTSGLRIHLSISHSRENAIAQVILER